ncbi:MAG: M14 family metallopeptidase [Patescibacteria group bacterium]
MRAIFKKYPVITICIFALFGIGVFAIGDLNKGEAPVTPAVLVKPAIIPSVEREVIGTSVEGRAIEAYLYGKGETHLLFVGGIHGGYEWNSVILAYRFMDYLEANPNSIPKNLTIAVIPSANPDGVYRVVGKEGRFEVGDVPNNQKLAESGRFNAHSVDLNRNFDCKWKPKSTWKNRVVSGGSKAFSEPEAAAIRDFVLSYGPDSVVFWHSKANAVYASKCEDGILPKTIDLMNAYARASEYTAIKSFDAYETSGDSEGWLASINIPSITVELKTHETVEWEQNLAGIKALFEYYGR